jgi:transcriptional regulator with XRE-family HTH domain
MQKKSGGANALQVQVGANIERLRQLKKKTPKQMAAQLGITEVAYRNIERGIAELSLNKIFQIAEVLELSYTQILDMDGSLVVNYNGGEYSGTNMGPITTLNNNHSDEGYKAAIEQYKKENEFLRQQLAKLIGK